MTHIHLSRRGAVGTITIDRPARFNSLDVTTAQDFRRAGLQCARDAGVRVVVLRGLPTMFCSGADLKYIARGGDADVAYLSPEARPTRPGYGKVFKQILEYIHSTISEIRRAPKPFLAAVDGPTAAGGLGIAMACDLVIAADRATFEWAYFKTGLTGAESTTFMLPRLVGFHKAMELVLLGDRLTATEACTLGLVNRVVPHAELDERALELAHRLAEAPTAAVGVAKRMLNRSAGMDRLDVQLDAELTELARIADGDNFAEGLSAFLEHRAPEFGVE